MSVQCLKLQETVTKWKQLICVEQKINFLPACSNFFLFCCSSLKATFVFVQHSLSVSVLLSAVGILLCSYTYEGVNKGLNFEFQIIH